MFDIQIKHEDESTASFVIRGPFFMLDLWARNTRSAPSHIELPEKVVLFNHLPLADSAAREQLDKIYAQTITLYESIVASGSSPQKAMQMLPFSLIVSQAQTGFLQDIINDCIYILSRDVDEFGFLHDIANQLLNSLGIKL